MGSPDPGHWTAPIRKGEEGILFATRSITTTTTKVGHEPSKVGRTKDQHRNKHPRRAIAQIGGADVGENDTKQPAGPNQRLAAPARS